MSLKGRKQSPEHIRKRALAHLGFRHSKESKMKIGEGSRGHKMPKHVKSNLIKINTGSTRNLGKKHKEETRRKMSDSHRKRVALGLNNFYKGGISKTNVQIRNSFEYTLWREAVFKRDNYTCVWCLRSKEVSGHLQADHIKPFALFPELRFAIDNGRTLCEDCHKKTDTYLWKLRN